ncbi:putative metalloprotease CJM1_0395 family protein, partial [Neptuniibacter pectenicola]|uniref:putative metalloprotease CJM1_0395 family protein n=1 Tax=Neptuniibacter pectenicola TaxID=1806669 RepID=UPI003EE9BA56
MQITSSSHSQALNANTAPIELRSQDAQRVLSSVANPASQEVLASNQGALNRDRVTLSAEAAALSRLASPSTGLAADEGEFIGLESTGRSITSATAPATSQEEEQQELAISRELAKRDREVKAHEQTHASIGGAYASAPSYTYERGPDGRMYAVEGEVKIDTSPIPNDPEATLEKAEIIQRAALSVSEPSSADRAAAA